jgi:hypothetical protein
MGLLKLLSSTVKKCKLGVYVTCKNSKSNASESFNLCFASVHTRLEPSQSRSRVLNHNRGSAEVTVFPNFIRKSPFKC